MQQQSGILQTAHIKSGLRPRKVTKMGLFWSIILGFLILGSIVASMTLGVFLGTALVVGLAAVAAMAAMNVIKNLAMPRPAAPPAAGGGGGHGGGH